jgi:hypothetical protein
MNSAGEAGVGITGCFLHIQGEISSEQLDVWILI